MLARALLVVSLGGLLIPGAAQAASVHVERGEVDTADGPIPYVRFGSRSTRCRGSAMHCDSGERQIA